MGRIVYHPRGGTTIIVPAGFVTDGTSFPVFLTPLFPRFDSSLLNKALVHDLLYWEQEIPRDAADSIMYTAMLDYGVSTFRATAIYWGLVAFGGLGWHLNQWKKKRGHVRYIDISSDDWWTRLEGMKI